MAGDLRVVLKHLDLVCLVSPGLPQHSNSLGRHLFQHHLTAEAREAQDTSQEDGEDHFILAKWKSEHPKSPGSLCPKCCTGPEGQHI